MFSDLRLPNVVIAYASNRSTIYETVRLLNMSVFLTILCLTISTVYALLNGFLLLIVNKSTIKQKRMINLYNRVI